MAAPKKPATDLIKQVKVHVKVSDLKVYDRKKIESLIEADKTGTSKSSAEITKEGALKVSITGFVVEAKDKNEADYLLRMRDKRRNTKNIIRFEQMSSQVN